MERWPAMVRKRRVGKTGLWRRKQGEKDGFRRQDAGRGRCAGRADRRKGRRLERQEWAGLNEKGD